MKNIAEYSDDWWGKVDLLEGTVLVAVAPYTQVRTFVCIGESTDGERFPLLYIRPTEGMETVAENGKPYWRDTGTSYGPELMSLLEATPEVALFKGLTTGDGGDPCSVSFPDGDSNPAYRSKAFLRTMNLADRGTWAMNQNDPSISKMKKLQ